MDRLSSEVQEGYIPFRGYQVWYRTVGNSNSRDKLPVLCLHGGPGGTSDYLEPLEALASTGRQIIFYDQLGCGNSDRPEDKSMWTVDLYVEEVGVVRQALGLDRIHLLGQSWGGMLAMEYVLTQPTGVSSMIVADSPASMPQWIAEGQRLRLELPVDVQETLLKHERAGTTSDLEYIEAMNVFYHRHVCRVVPYPEPFARELSRLSEVYEIMNGPTEFAITGTLKDWDIVDRLHEIRAPTLLVSGRHDEATPAIVETIHERILESQWVLFEDSSHLPHLEETERFLDVVTTFLTQVEVTL